MRCKLVIPIFLLLNSLTISQAILPDLNKDYLIESDISSFSHLEYSSWKFQKDIIIRDVSGKNFSDVQVLVELSSLNFDFENANIDGSDLRFVSDGVQLPYWIESWDSSNEISNVWVKVPFIPANNHVMIKLYYGNTEAVSAEDGAETFVFFENFEDEALDLNKWSLDNLQNYKNYYIKDSKLHLIGKNEIKTYLKSNSLLPRDYTVMIKFLIGNKENSLSLGIGNGKNKGPNYLFDYTNWKQHQVGYEIEFDETNGKTFYLGKGLNYEIMGGEWYIGRLDVINSSFIDSTLIDPNNKQVLAYYETASDYSTDDYRLHICNLIKYNKQNFIDWIFITNYSIKITQEISSNEIVLVLQDYDEDLKDRILLNDSTVVYINLSHNIVNFKGCAFSILGLNYFRWYIFDQINGINDTCWDLNIYSNPIKAQILIDDN